MKESLKICAEMMEMHREALNLAKAMNNIHDVETHRDGLWFWQDLYRKLV